MKILAALCIPALCVAITPAPPGGCGANSTAIGSFQLLVQQPQGGKLPIRSVQLLNKDYKVTYKPVTLPQDMKKDARVALIYMDAGGDSQMSVLDLYPAASTGEWSIPARVGVLVFAFGPQGLDEKKVTNLVTKDKRLISQIAQYADQTSIAEDNLDLLSMMEASDDDDLSQEQIRNNPTDRMLAALVRALSGTNYGIDASGAGRRAPIVGMKAKASETFFENAGGMFTGGSVLPEVKSWLFPETEFRSAYAVAGPEDSVSLCGRFLTQGSKSRTVYLWAHRFVDTPAPQYTLASAAHVPLGARARLNLTANADPSAVAKVREWALKPVGQTGEIPVRVSAQGRALELDLRTLKAAPGRYQLAGRWDFEPVRVDGDIMIYAADNLAGVKAQGAPVAGSGIVPLLLEGADFQFVERINLRRNNGQQTLQQELDWQTPARDQGPQKTLLVELDTDRLRAGNYLLALNGAGQSRELPVEILPAPPQFENLPVQVAYDAAEQQIVLRGRGVERIQSLSSEGASLRPAPFDFARPNERIIFAKLKPEWKTGALLGMNVVLVGSGRGVPVLAALQVGGAKPKIVSSKISLPENLSVAVKSGELPAGSFVTAYLKVETSDAKPVLRMQCADSGKQYEAKQLVAGEKRDTAKLEMVGAGMLFLSFDPGAMGPAGCQLSASLGGDVVSDAIVLGKVIRLPRIENFAMTDEKLSGGNFAGILRGFDLELIEKTGWDLTKGVAVESVPVTAAASGQLQTLRIGLSWPSPTPKAPIYVWLRGEADGRLVSAQGRF